MQNYEKIRNRIYSVRESMDALLEFVENNPCGEECGKCTKLKINKSESFLAGMIVGMVISGVLAVPFALYIFSSFLPGGAI